MYINYYIMFDLMNQNQFTTSLQYGQLIMFIYLDYYRVSFENIT